MRAKQNRMFYILSIMFGGILAGYLMRNAKPVVRLGKSGFINLLVWAMLFILGAEIGSDPDFLGKLSRLGFQALVFASAGVCGSVAAAVLVQKFLSGKGKCIDGTVGRTDSPDSFWRSMRGTLAVLAFFVAGCAAGQAGIIPANMKESNIAMYTLYILMFSVGLGIGSNPELKTILRSLDISLLALPLASILGTLAFSAAAGLFMKDRELTDCLAIGSGMGYYSLSSILISQYKEATSGALLAAELGTVALLSNIFREMITLIGTPFMARKFGPLAPVASAGATAMDVCLPVILKYTGNSMLPAAVISGIVSDFSVPLLVTLFC